MTVDGVSDVFRMINAVLAVAALGLLIATRAYDKTQHPVVFTAAMFLGWQAYTSIEVLVQDTDSTLESAVRVGGFTVILITAVIVLTRDLRRRRRYLKGQR